MPESREQLTQKDIQGPEKKSTEPSLEIAKGPELDELANAAGNLASKIEGDKDVFQDDLDRLRKALEKMKVNIGGEEMTVEEVKKIPDLKMNMRLWKRIKAGEHSVVSQMTYVSLEVADILKNYMGNVLLPHVKYLSSSVFKRLSERKGYLSLAGIEEISDQDAEALSHHQGELFLDNITSLSVKQAEFLSQNNGTLSLVCLETLPDQAAIYFIDFKHFLNIQSRIIAQINRLKKRSRKK